MKINNKLIKKLYNCVVRITSQKIKFNWNNPSDKTEEGQGVGTGFFINKKGDILTCWHVIAESNENYINIPGIEKKYKCEVISVCPYLDLALMNVKDYKPKDFLTLGNSDKLMFGTTVSAIGYPLGQEKLKITRGVISGREMNRIQTDTPLNPGNSGGPLISNDLKVIGINVSGFAPKVAENVGFAIPINNYKSIKSLLTKKNKIVFRPVLGAIFQKMNNDLLTFYGVNKKFDNKGILVKEVIKKSPLKNYIKKGDIILKINNYSIDNNGECKVPWNIDKVPLVTILQNYTPNDYLNINYFSKNEKKLKNIKIKMIEEDKIFKIRYKFVYFEPVDYIIFSGIIFMNFSYNHLENMNNNFFEGNSCDIVLEKLKEDKNRQNNVVIISNIFKSSEVFKEDILNPYDIIKKINNIKINDLNDIRKAILKPIIGKFDKKKYIIIETIDNKIMHIKLSKATKEYVLLSKLYNFKSKEMEKLIQKVK